MRDDPWAFEEEDLLRRVSEEQQFTHESVPTKKSTTDDGSLSRIRGGMSNDTVSDVFSQTVASPNEQHLVGSSDTRAPTPNQGMDLWSMWEESKESAGTRGSGDADREEATPPTRLRASLARPERIGRRPVVLPEVQSERVSRIVGDDVRGGQ